jgi:hypothetical protein
LPCFFPRTSREILGINRDQLSKNLWLVELRAMLGWSNIFKILISLERTPTHGTSAKKTRFSQWFSQGKRINEQLIHFSSNNFKLTIIVTFTDWCKWFLKWTTRIFFFVTWKLGFVPQKQKQAPGRFFWTLTSQNPCVPDCQQSNYFTTEKKEELCFFFSVSLFWAR